jgi:hypothetical protein
MDRHVAQVTSQQRKNIRQPPLHCVQIRQMREIAEEDDIASAPRASPAARNVSDERDRGDARAWALMAQKFFFVSAYDDGGVRCAGQGKLRFHLFGNLREIARSFDRGAAGFTEEM